MPLPGDGNLVSYAACWVDSSYIKFFHGSAERVRTFFLQQGRELVDFSIRGVAVNPEIKANRLATGWPSRSDRCSGICLLIHLFPLAPQGPDGESHSQDQHVGNANSRTPVR